MNPKKILVVEDDKDLLINITTLLKEEGYETLTAENGKIGIEKAQEFLPDLIICDVIMPVATGYDVLNEISKSKITRSIPFIFLTAKVERIDIRLGMELGADDYLFKPFDVDELLSAIKSRLNKHEVMIADYVKENKLMIKTDKKYAIDEKLLLTINGRPIFLTIGEIKYIVSEDHYTVLKLTTGKTVFMRRSIKSWEDSLPEKIFLRIHRSTIINMDLIVKMEKWHNSSMSVYLKDVNSPFIISKRYIAKIKGKLK